MKTFIFSLLFLLSLSVQCLAGSDSGIYIGASVGQGTMESDVLSVDIDEDASGYKLIAGYNFGLVPTVDLAVEIDYRDFGSFENNNMNFQSDITTFDVYGLAGMNFGPVGVFGKLGFSDSDLEGAIDGDNFSGSDSNTTYGLGAKIGLGSLAIRAEYEVFDLDDVEDLSMLSVGLILTF